MKKYLLLIFIPLLLFNCGYKEPEATYELIGNRKEYKNPENLLSKYIGIIKESKLDSIVYSFDFYKDHTYLVKIDKTNKDSTQIHQGTWVSNGEYFVIYSEDATAYRFLKKNNELSLLNDDGRLYSSENVERQFILKKQ